MKSITAAKPAPVSWWLLIKQLMLLQKGISSGQITLKFGFIGVKQVCTGFN